MILLTACSNELGVSSSYNDSSGTGSGSSGGPIRTLYMFVSTTGGFGNIQGDFGGRGPGNTLCANERAADHAALACTQDFIFASFSAADEVRDLPVTYNFSTSSSVQRPDGTPISATFSGLIAGAGIALTNAPGTGVAQAWTGSDNSGAFLSDACNGFTGGVSAGARSGNVLSTAANFLSNATDACGLTNEVYCMCY